MKVTMIGSRHGRTESSWVWSTSGSPSPKENSMAVLSLTVVAMRPPVTMTPRTLAASPRRSKTSTPNLSTSAMPDS